MFLVDDTGASADGGNGSIVDAAGGDSSLFDANIDGKHVLIQVRMHSGMTAPHDCFDEGSQASF
jgi:hypothetical protein